ncbi:hypothetical protein BaRGS_00006556 [Batillaria attramentaria]|uniref:Uncharacterized protein n=1 Tax=Batillaria attramentaria TaxID=370345 RepID=A0ABD0LS71_9CAEN
MCNSDPPPPSGHLFNPPPLSPLPKQNKSVAGVRARTAHDARAETLTHFLRKEAVRADIDPTSPSSLFRRIHTNMAKFTPLSKSNLRRWDGVA